MSTPPISYSREAAGPATGVSTRTIDRAIAAGDLPVHYQGRSVLILAEDLVAWVKSLPTEKRSA